MDEVEALQWLTAMAAHQAEEHKIVVDERSGVFGHRVSMLDFSPEDLARFRELGRLVETVLAVLDSFPTESTPGPQPGYVGVTFVMDGETLNLWFKITRADEARQQGLHGAALLKALGG